MPIFEYRCAACGHLEEVLQKHTDPAPPSCAKCHAASTMSKELSLSAFHLKGGGWYKDLYASSSSPASADSPSTSSTPATDSTPAASAAPASTPAPAPASASTGSSTGSSTGTSTSSSST
jgi:putative FmdB family regulatory protein